MISTKSFSDIFLGCSRIVEKMLMYYPDYINLKKDDDGYSLIHVAAANSQLEMLSLLLQQVCCFFPAEITDPIITTRCIPIAFSILPQRSVFIFLFSLHIISVPLLL